MLYQGTAVRQSRGNFPHFLHVELSERSFVVGADMTTTQDLIKIEKNCWTLGQKFYRDNVDEKCLIAFPQMASVMSNAGVAATIKEDQRWRNVEIEPKGLVEPTSDLAILTYEASATSHDGKPYKALVSSGYIRREGAWKMAFHQQTPLPADA